jgi:hypothetical protein
MTVKERDSNGKGGNLSGTNIQKAGAAFKAEVNRKLVDQVLLNIKCSLMIYKIKPMHARVI